jgi:hypothetical protein
LDRLFKANGESGRSSTLRYARETRSECEAPMKDWISGQDST